MGENEYSRLPFSVEPRHEIPLSLSWGRSLHTADIGPDRREHIRKDIGLTRKTRQVIRAGIHIHKPFRNVQYIGNGLFTDLKKTVSVHEGSLVIATFFKNTATINCCRHIFVDNFVSTAHGFPKTVYQCYDTVFFYFYSTYCPAWHRNVFAVDRMDKRSMCSAGRDVPSLCEKNAKIPSAGTKHTKKGTGQIFTICAVPCTSSVHASAPVIYEADHDS